MLKQIAEAVTLKGHIAFTAPFNEPPPIEAFLGCDVLVLGPSSRDIEGELSLLEACLAHRPEMQVYVVEDVPGGPMARPAFVKAGWPTKVAGLFLAMPQPQWRKMAKQLGYQKIEYVGPPPHWGPAYETMTSGPNIRDRLYKNNGVRTEPIFLADEVFFFGGTKNSLVTNRVLGALKKAGMNFAGSKFVLGFKAHPGEQPKAPSPEASHDDWQAYRSALLYYEGMIDERYEILAGGIWNLDFSDAEVDSSVLLPALMKAVDVPILTSGATDSIVAAYARLSAGWYFDANIREDLLRLGIPDGKWFVSELGGVHTIHSPESFEDAIHFLLSPEGKKSLRESQEANFPLPKDEDWDTAPIIVRCIEKNFENRAVA